MPKRYEEEINEILHKFDWPPPGAARPRGKGPARGGRPSGGSSISPNQLMALGLIFILAGAAIHLLGLASGVALGTYATWIGVLVLLGGYIMAVTSVRGGRLPGRSTWRGSVVDLPPRGRGLAYWWWRLTAALRGRP
ncbi:MAG: hypothetical protein ACRDHX_02195 [Chloroflexota bacterium]